MLIADEDNAVASDEDIEDSLMAQYLDVLVDRRKKQEQQNSYYNNIILFETEKPEKLKNTILAFNPVDLQPLFEATNLQLSSLVPVIQIFKIYKKTSGDEELEVMLPFPEYTYKEDLDQIFESRTGRGAGIGIKSFQWNSMAKNQANMAQFSADLKLYLQDAGELTKIRNQVVDGKNTYSASVLDLLYPVVRDETAGPFEYNPRNFFLKVRVGWKLKEDIGDPNLQIDQSLLKSLVSEYHLTLYKHDISFERDGSVTLDIKFLAMAEALLDDYSKADVFFERYVDHSNIKEIKEKTKKIRELQEQKVKASDEKGWLLSTDTSEKEQVQEEIDKLQAELEQTKLYQKRSKRVIYKNFLSWLIKGGKLNFFNLSKEEKQELKILSTYKSSLLESEDVSDISRSIKERNEKATDTKQPNPEQIKKVNTAIVTAETEEAKDKYHIDINKVNSILKDSIKEKYENKDKGGNIITSYFYLGDLLEYFIGRFADNRPEMAGNQVPTGDNIGNKKMRIVLGTFSYSDYGNPQIGFQGGGISYKTKTVKRGETKKVVTLTGKKKVANLAHVPISFKSFMRWFNNKIIDSNLEKYSLNRFIRDVMYDLVPANLSNRILKATPPTKISITMNSESVDDDLEFAKGQTISSFLSDTHRNRNNYIVDFDNQVMLYNPFRFLKTTKSKAEVSRSSASSNRKLANYIFLFSNNEYSEDLKRNYTEDIKNNILHFYIGEEKGMIKSIDFSREDNPRLDAHNIQVANQENQGAIIRNVYHAKLEMFGNTIFTPGSMLFINPTYPGMRLGDKTLFDVGLGGYFLVLSTSNKISSGVYTTSIETKWQSFGNDSSRIEMKDLTPEIIADLKRQGFTAQYVRFK